MDERSGLEEQYEIGGKIGLGVKGITRERKGSSCQSGRMPSLVELDQFVDVCGKLLRCTI